MSKSEFSRKQVRVLIRRRFSAVPRKAGVIRSVSVAALPVVALLSVLSAGMAAAGPVGAFRFEPLAESSPCVAGGPDFSQVPLTLPSGFSHNVLATEGPNFPDQADMHTLNETGAHAGRFLFHTHEVRDTGAVSVTDLVEGTTTLLEQQSHWERLDGIDWTPWGTLIFAEEVRANRSPRLLDPNAPHALGGLVYEADPADPASAVVRPAIGSRAHEGLSFDGAGTLYGISEVGAGQGGGAIFKFVPDRRGDLSSGQVYALKVEVGTTGAAEWIALDRHESEVDSDAEAIRKGATRYAKAEDLEIWAETLFVAVSDDHRVIAVDLRDQKTNEQGNQTTFVWDYVKAGVNAPTAEPRNTSPNSFAGPDNLAFDPMGHLYISEDPGGKAPQKKRGNDVWVAIPDGNPGSGAMAQQVVRFASLTDCNAEASGIYFDRGGRTLYVHIMHRGGSADGDLNLPDQSIAITQE